ncbi:PREDICTED: probable FBD-associated F-box protein At1g32375 [Camelina sativa]|uniref:Probable FBD-associated F-box protein At1g32375 n=1 Tax=Camelina sativa TaxID=90675 RepID=A0ABM1RA26_CAMSA|nr:PREDICTED: probable FBD-associated F-box protein At1g32375 [Camelina sativa]
MATINQLSDALLLKILSFLHAKDVVATMVLSKRWRFLWMSAPKLIYDDSYHNVEYGRFSFSRFVDRSLFMHEAPDIETLHFKLGQLCGSKDLRMWIRAADKGCVRELVIEIENKTPVTLPRSLYTCCRMLVTLKLRNAVLVDDTNPISFPSLKKLSLESMKYPCDEFANRILSSCPILEDLVVEQCPDDNVAILSIRIPSLRSLFLHKSDQIVNENAHGFLIDAPSLECLDIVDYSHGFRTIESNMCKIGKANVDISHPHTEQLLGSLTKAKRLFLCLPTSKDAYPVGSLFSSLAYLKLCTCETEWLNILICVLRDSPNLRALELSQYHPLRTEEPRPCWNEPSSIPECILYSLESFKWVNYQGTKEEKELVGFIFRNGTCLKKATIISPNSMDGDKKLEMLMELSFSSRRSPICELEFS